MRENSIKFFSIIFSSVILAVIFYNLYISWSDFISICPSKDVLSWDANLRFLTTLDVYYNFRGWNIGKGILIFLDSPTWPPLRTFLSLVAVSISGEPDTVHDVFISYIFYILLFPSIAYILFRLNIKYLFLVPLLFVTSSATVIFTYEIKAYSLSSMLETQGMLFLLWSVFFSHNLWKNSDPGGKNYNRSVYGFSASFILLFFTKYPYGLMFILAAVLHEVITNHNGLLTLLKYIYKNHLRFYRIIYLTVIPAAFIVIKIISPPGEVNVIRKLIYLSFLILFIDFNVLYYKNFGKINACFSVQFSAMYRYGFLPALIWLVMHMDRFNSILDTQAHIQDSKRSYMFSFFNDLFVLNFISVLFAVTFILWLIIFLWDMMKSNKNIQTAGPYFFSLFILLGQILIMEISTENKQLRHIYHIIPALSVFLFSSVLSEIFMSPTAQKYRFEVSLVLILSAFSFVFIIYSNLPDFQKSKEIPLCFTGTDKEIYDPPRYFASHIKSENKFLLFNNFHIEPFPPRGYAISTDFDILIYKKIFHGGYAERFNKHTQYKMNSYDFILYINRDCSLSAKFKEFLMKYKISSVPVKSLTHESTQYCMSEFSTRADKK